MPELQEPYIYTDLNEVPVQWRSYKGARLNLEQINDIIKDAYANQIVNGDSYIPDYGGARARFEAGSEIESNFWVARSNNQPVEVASVRSQRASAPVKEEQTNTLPPSEGDNE